MNAGELVSTLRINRSSESWTRGVGGRELGLKEGEGKEKGTPDNCTVWARISFCE